MKMRLDITLDIPGDSLHKLRQLAGVTGGSNAEAAEHLRGQAAQVVIDHLAAQGIPGVTWNRSGT
jgi:hypothetical protein